jgi:hypothetical protein
VRPGDHAHQQAKAGQIFRQRHRGGRLRRGMMTEREKQERDRRLAEGEDEAENKKPWHRLNRTKAVEVRSQKPEVRRKSSQAKAAKPTQLAVIPSDF